MGLGGHGEAVSIVEDGDRGGGSTTGSIYSSYCLYGHLEVLLPNPTLLTLPKRCRIHVASTPPRPRTSCRSQEPTPSISEDWSWASRSRAGSLSLRTGGRTVGWRPASGSVRRLSYGMCVCSLLPALFFLFCHTVYSGWYPIGTCTNLQ